MIIGDFDEFETLNFERHIKIINSLFWIPTTTHPYVFQERNLTFTRWTLQNEAVQPLIKPYTLTPWSSIIRGATRRTVYYAFPKRFLIHWKQTCNPLKQYFLLDLSHTNSFSHTPIRHNKSKSNEFNAKNIWYLISNLTKPKYIDHLKKLVKGFNLIW